MRTVLFAAFFALFARPLVASSNPDETQDLKRRLEEALKEIDRLRREGTFSVECQRSDLRRERPSAGDEGDIERVLSRLSGLGVDPAFTVADIGLRDPAPAAYVVRPGCAFLGGDRITEVNGVPVSDRSRVRAMLISQDRWRFTVSARTTEPQERRSLPTAGKFDLGRTLGLSGSEAILMPALIGAEERGFLVWSVASGGAIAQAGLRSRDVLIEVNNVGLRHADAEKTISREWTTRGILQMIVERDGHRVSLTPIVDQSKARR
jgi:hypothetical protein